MIQRRGARAVSRTVTVAAVIVIIIIIAAGAYFALSQQGARTGSTTTPTTGTSVSGTSSSSTGGSSTSSASASVPSSFTYETTNTAEFLDPQVIYEVFDDHVSQQVYEHLLWYNQSSPSQVIPWLASNYTTSSDGKSVNFTLRNGISFTDGEPLNATAVYFSFNRLLIFDGSTPTSHGTQASWILWQLLNESLSSTLGGPHAYTQAWAQQVLAQNLVQVTGPLTFTLHIQRPNPALPYILSTGAWAEIVAPAFFMQHDMALWNQSSTGYTLPYPSLSGNETTMINEYLKDAVATCDSGTTPSGCATTYFDGSDQGSNGGTGPYIMQSVDHSSNNIVLKANLNYWGGPYQYLGGSKVIPQITTININYVPNLNTRELDLKSASGSGRAIAIDAPNDHVFDFIDRSTWLNNRVMQSTIPGVTVHGPLRPFETFQFTFNTNVTNPQTGTFYKFQPFSDIRFRLAFADSVNLTEVNQATNNLLGSVADTAVSPGMFPVGSDQVSTPPRYSYNPDQVQSLLLDAMMHPLTSFTFKNGTSAPAGLFSNTFGCSSLGSNGQCASPVPQTLAITVPSGDTVNEAIANQMAATLNNVSGTYNMGLSVGVVPMPIGQMFTLGFSGELYSWPFSNEADYPYATDYLGIMYAPGNVVSGPVGWNLTSETKLYAQLQIAQASNNNSGIAALSNEMNSLANQQVLYLWTLNPVFFQPVTSNVQGFVYNPAKQLFVQFYANLH